MKAAFTPGPVAFNDQPVEADLQAVDTQVAVGQILKRRP
jgi:hypothetical protein